MKTFKPKVNIALQVLPRSAKKDTYSLVDKAIETIDKSGVKYKVCPFETVLEGRYSELIEIIGKSIKNCLDSGADEIIAYIKVQINRTHDVLISDKMEKYE